MLSGPLEPFRVSLVFDFTIADALFLNFYI